MAIVMYWQQKNIKNSSRSTAFSDKILTKELQQMMTGGIDNGKGIDQPGKICAGRRRDEKLGEYAQNYGKKALILISKGDTSESEQWWRKVLKEKNVDMFLITSMVNAVKRNQTSWRNRERRSV